MVDEKRSTRDRILEAALEVFFEKGFGEATVNNITEVAGTSHGTFYIYFKNKRDLLWDLVQVTFGKLYYSTQDPWKKGNIYDSLEQSVRGWFRVQTEYWKIIRIWQEVAYSDEEFAALWEHLSKTITLRIQQNIEASIQTSTCRRVNPPVVATAISGMIEHYAHIVLFREEKFDLEEIVTAIADLWYHAIYVLSDDDANHGNRS